MGRFNTKVQSPGHDIRLLGCTFAASGSGTSVNYDWSFGMSGSACVRNDSGSFTLNLDGGANEFVSGAINATLQYADDTANENNNYRLFLSNVYLKESGSFDVNVLSGSNAVRHDAAGCKVHVTIMATRGAYRKNWK